MTRNGTTFLPDEKENCRGRGDGADPLQITAEELERSVRCIPHLTSLILVKAMLRKHSFHHPFKGSATRFFSLPPSFRFFLSRRFSRVSPSRQFQPNHVLYFNS